MNNMVHKWGETLAESGFAQIPNHLLMLNKFIIKEQRLTPVELLVVLQLVSFWWNKEEMPFPSTGTLAEGLGVSERQVQRAVTRLVRDKIIAKTKRKSRGMVSRNVYDLAPLVETLGSVSKEYPNPHVRNIMRGRFKASATS